MEISESRCVVPMLWPTVLEVSRAGNQGEMEVLRLPVDQVSRNSVAGPASGGVWQLFEVVITLSCWESDGVWVGNGAQLLRP